MLSGDAQNCLTVGRKQLGIVKKVLARHKNMIVAVALVLSIGLHWPLLQSVAWLNMIVSYSKQDGFEKAISKTFDGKHPCNLCKMVSTGKKAEKKQTKELALKKVDLFVRGTQVALFAHSISIPHPDFAPSIQVLTYPPLRPPPNFA